MSDSTSRDDENATGRDRGGRNGPSGSSSDGDGSGASDRGRNPAESRGTESRGADRRPRRDGETAHRGHAPRAGAGRKPQGERSGGPSKPWEKRDGSAPARRPASGKPWEKRDGAGSPRRPNADRGGEKKLWTRDGAPARGDRDAHRREVELTEEEKLAKQLKSVRPRHDDPDVPDDVTADQLDRVARNELKTLSKDNAEGVAKHLVMAARLIEDDPELAHRHALSAARRAGRIAIVRETLAITAYATGDFALAIRELRTYRRISGLNDQLPLMVDSERGVGRPDRALEVGRSVDRSTLPNDVQASLAIAMSGARLDQGDPEAALMELEVSQLDPDRAYPYSADLYLAYAEVLDELDRSADAMQWRARAERADAAFAEASDSEADETVDVFEEDEVAVGSADVESVDVESDGVESAGDGSDDHGRGDGAVRP
jgi:hypothetical protein